MDLICGINPVIEALTSGSRHFDRLLIVKGIRNRRVSDAIARASQMGVPLRFEARETLDRMAGGLPHQGIIAVVSAKPVIDLEELFRTTREPGLLVVLDGVEDPRNLGAILRSVEASGADGVLLPERHSTGLSETVGRASAGAIEHVRVARIGNVTQALETLKSRGYWIVGFDGTATERWDAVDYRRPVALVFGGEGRGIRRLVKEHCDHLVSLPLFGHVQSLNVSVAAGIALYEVVRQRGAVPSHVRPIPIRPASAEKQIIGPPADDAEHDPGVVPPVLDGHVDDLEEDPIRFVHIEEQDASGPTVIKHAVERRYGRGDERRRFARGQGRGRGADRDRGGERPAGAEARQAPSENGNGDPAGDTKRGGPAVREAGEQGQGRRRRRRRRRGGGPSAPAGPQGGAPSEQAGTGETRSPVVGGAGVPSGDGAPGTGTPGRRRRRRRRRR